MIGEMDIMKWCIREIQRGCRFPVISNVLAVVRLQADREEDNSLVLWELVWVSQSSGGRYRLNSKKIAKPARLELNPPAVALTAKFDYWRTFSSTAVVIVLFQTHNPHHP